MTRLHALPFAGIVGACCRFAMAAIAILAFVWQPAPLRGQPLGAATAHLLLVATAESQPQIRLRGPLPAIADRLIWMEITSLESDARPTRYLLREDRRALPVLGIAEGAAMVCVGIEMRSVTCREVYVELAHSQFTQARLSETLGTDPTGIPGIVAAEGAEANALAQLAVPSVSVAELAIEIERGVPIVGRYSQGGEPVVGARVSVVPDGLDIGRPFVMPLGVDAPPTPPEATAARQPQGNLGRLRREVVTGDDGQFRLPELAPGGYRLEALLPSGRLHHSDVFVAVPPSPTLAVLDLGTFAVVDGLRVGVQVVDDTGAAIVGAAVSARQGTRVVDAAFFQARTDREGQAWLSGFLVELPVHLRCDAEGHVPQVTDHDLLPVETSCVLARQGRISGQAIGPTGEAPSDTRLTLFHLATEDDAENALADVGATVGDSADAARDREEAVVRQRATSLTGTFDLRELDPGTYRLELAAPGFAPTSQTVDVAPGGRVDLGVIYLNAAPSLEGIVIDAEDETPLAGVAVRVLRPAGGGADVTDNAGAFSITDAGAETTMVIEARHPDYAVTRQAVEPRPDRTLDDGLRIGLRRGGRILIVVWDANTGRTCRGCAVAIEPGGFELKTDASGEVLSDLLLPGRYRVELSRVTHLGSTVVEEPEAAVRYVRVREGGIAPVWFGDRTQPVQVRFRPHPGPRWTLIGRSQDRAQRVEPDVDGTFTLEQEVGETIGLYLEGWDAASGSTIEVRQGQLLPGEGPREVVFDLPTGTLRGRLTSGGGAAAGVRVRLRGLHDRARAALLRTDPDGSFHVPHLPPGVYALEAGDRPLKFVRIGTGERVDLGSWDLFSGSF